jgi:hypothetical protein
MTPTLFPRAAPLIAQVIREWVAGQDQITVATKMPAARAFPGSPPHILVQQDGPGDDMSRAMRDVLIRVTVFAPDEDWAENLAELIHADLLAYSGPHVASILPDATPYPATDPDTGEPCGSFTVQVHVRPQAC